MKLKQIKEFTQFNITQDFAAELAALTIWNHYRDDEYKNRGFEIVNTRPEGVLKGGGGSKSHWEEDKYVKTATGVEITTCLHDVVRVFKNGHVMARWRESTVGEYEYITRNVRSGKETSSINTISITRQTQIVQLYLDHGFFTIE